MKSVLSKFCLFFLLSTSLFSCSKDDAVKETIVKITVTNKASVVQSNFTVFQISDTKFNAYGADSFFKDQQSVTESNGIATFKIDNVDFSTGGQRTYYFFSKYTLNGTNKTKSTGITLSQGDTKTTTLILD